MTTSLRVLGAPGEQVPTSDLDPFSDEFLTDPYPSHAELRQAGPVVWLNRYRVWAVTRHADVDRVLKDPDTYCSSAGGGAPAESPTRGRLTGAQPSPGRGVSGAHPAGGAPAQRGLPAAGRRAGRGAGAARPVRCRERAGRGVRGGGTR